MRKVISLVVAMLLVPTMAMAMQSMSNGDMENVTGQAGVSIAVDDFKMYQNIDGLWYTDTDGLATANVTPAVGMDAASTAGGAASVGIERFEAMVEVNAITSGASNVSDGGSELGSTGRALQGDYTNAANYDFANADVGGNDVYLAKAIQIDVTDALPVIGEGVANNEAKLSTGVSHTDVAGVRIGLGTMEIVQSNMSLEIAVNDGNPLDGTNAEAVKLGNFDADASYGTILLACREKGTAGVFGRKMRHE